MNDFWLEVLQRLPITAVMAVVSSVVFFAFSQWLTHRWQERIRKGYLRALAEEEKKRGERPVCLVLSVLADIRQAALEYLKAQGFTVAMPLFQVHQQEGFGTKQEQWAHYLEQVKAEILKIRELGVTRVYLFTNVPIALALFAGATLTNGPEVIVHHFQGGYFPVGRLTVETVRL